MTRVRILLVLLALALAAAALPACGGSEESPQEALDGVSFEGVESAAFEASLGIRVSGRDAADVEVDVSGRFQRRGFDLPLLAATATVEGAAKGEQVDFEGGLILLDDHGFVNYKGTEYEIDPNNFAFGRSIFLPGSEGEGGKAGDPAIAACSRALSGVPISSLVEKPRSEGEVEVNGEATTKISGDLDVTAFGELLLDLAGDLDCRTQIEAISPVPLYELRQITDELSGAVQRAHIEVYVGDDEIVRRLLVEFSAKRGGRGAAVDLDLSLADVNEQQKIEPAAGGKPLLVLFQKLGVNPAVFLTSSGSEVVDLFLEKVAADVLP